MSNDTVTRRDDPAPARSSDITTRIFGGAPLAVLARLVILSILIGFVMHALGLDPLNILSGLRKLFQGIWDMGFDAIRYVWGYFLLGAVVVIPIWIVVRLLNAPRGR